MEFIKQMEVGKEITYESQDAPEFVIKKYRPIHFKNDISISIQCGNTAYSTPKNNVPLKEYKDMEISFRKNNKVCPMEEVLPDFKKLEEMRACKLGTVYGYIPIKLVEEIYKEMSKKYGKIAN